MKTLFALLLLALLSIAHCAVEVLDFSQYGFTSTSTVYEGHFALFVVQSQDPSHSGFCDTKFFTVDSSPSANHTYKLWYEVSTKEIFGSLPYAAADTFVLVTADAVVLVPTSNPSQLTILPLTNKRPDLTLSSGVGYDSRDQTVWLSASSNDKEGNQTVLFQVSLAQKVILNTITVPADLHLSEPLLYVYIAINEISNEIYLFSSTDNQSGCGLTRLAMDTHKPNGFISLDCNSQDSPLGIFEDSKRSKIFALTSQAAGTLAIIDETNFNPSATTYQPIDTTFNGLASKYGSMKTDYGLISSLNTAMLYSTSESKVAAQITVPIPTGNYVNAFVADSKTNMLFLVADQSVILFHRSDMTPAAFF